MEQKAINLNGLQVHYKITGSADKPAILILHGWGSSSDSWVKIQEMLAARKYLVIIPDLPGFGKTPAPQSIWGVEEYTDFIRRFTQTLGLEGFILLGHSFGGQTAAHFTVQYPETVEKLILFAPAIVRRKAGFKEYILRYFAKFFGFFLYLIPFEDLRNNIRNAFYMFIRRRDYARTQGIMKDIFKKVITQDATALCPQIKVPTLIIWGDKDVATPIQDAYTIKERIAGSSLTVIPGQGHNLHFVVPDQFVQTITQFLRP